MYNFVYYFIYNIAKKKNPAPESYSAGAVLIMIVFHLGMIFGIIKFFLGWSLPRFHEDYVPNKLYLLPIFFIVYWLVSNYYERRSGRIFDKYDKLYARRNLCSIKNIALIIGLFTVPLIIGIKFINMSV